MSSALTEKQLTAARLLSEGLSRSAVAAAVEVHRKTIYDWLKEPEFADLVNDLLTEARDSTRTKLCQLSNSAITALKEIIENKDESASARVSACTKVLSFVLGESDFIKESDVPKTPTIVSKKDLLRQANAAMKEAYGLSSGGNES